MRVAVIKKPGPPSQLAPPDEVTLVVTGLVNGERAFTDDQKLRLVQERVEDLLRNRIRLLRIEASTISSDMEALVLRLDRDGCLARLADIKSARWYRTAGDFRLLQGLYEFVVSLTGRPGSIRIDDEGDDPDTDPDVSENDPDISENDE